MELIVYLAGEIHSDWRGEIVAGAEREGLPIEFLSPVTDHSASDDVGVGILGGEENDFWKDHKGASINAIPTWWRSAGTPKWAAARSHCCRRSL